jgi:hypothetical protein
LIDLKYILNNCYPSEDQEKAIQLLEEFGFDNHLKSCIEIINSKLDKEPIEIAEFGVIQLGSVTSSILSGVNEKIRLIPKEKLHPDLEQILADISKALLEHVLFKTKSDKKLLIDQIAVSLHDTCDIHNYSEEEVFKFLGFDQLKHHANILLQGDRAIIPKTSKKCNFHWIGEPKKKTAFMELFTDHGLIINSKRSNHHLLFNRDTTESLEIEFNPVKSREIMTFFFLLKNEYKLLKGPKEGFYAPLNYHSIGFDKIILDNKTPGDYNDMLKKNKAEWTENIGKINKWIAQIL